MNWSQFRSDYQTIASLLPQNFMTDADPENTLRRAIEQDRTSYLESLEKLAEETPAKEIRKDAQRLHSKTTFQSFYAEMRAFIALQNWVFVPRAADVKGSQGNPDYEFNIDELDIEVTSRTAWDKKDNVVVTLKNKLDGTPYISKIILLDNFNKIPYTGPEIAHNENLVDDIITKIDGIDPSNPPTQVSNSGIRIKFEKANGSGSIITWDSAEAILLDPQGSIVDQLRDKVKKQRGSRPLLIFYDTDVPMLEVDDMERLVHGSRYSGPEIKVSDTVYQHEPVWGDYLREQGYIPESGRKTYAKTVKPDDPKYDLKHKGDSCIRDGDEGIFADAEFNRVAGVLFVDKTNHAHFLPNFYSDKVNFYLLYRQITDNMDMNKLSALI
jgi:hypothetical protein